VVIIPENQRVLLLKAARLLGDISNLFEQLDPDSPYVSRPISAADFVQEMGDLIPTIKDISITLVGAACQPNQIKEK